MVEFAAFSEEVRLQGGNRRNRKVVIRCWYAGRNEKGNDEVFSRIHKMRDNYSVVQVGTE